MDCLIYQHYIGTLNWNILRILYFIVSPFYNINTKILLLDCWKHEYLEFFRLKYRFPKYSLLQDKIYKELHPSSSSLLYKNYLRLIWKRLWIWLKGYSANITVYKNKNPHHCEEKIFFNTFVLLYFLLSR